MSNDSIRQTVCRACLFFHADKKEVNHGSSPEQLNVLIPSLRKHRTNRSDCSKLRREGTINQGDSLTWKENNLTSQNLHDMTTSLLHATKDGHYHFT